MTLNCRPAIVVTADEANARHAIARRCDDAQTTAALWRRLPVGPAHSEAGAAGDASVPLRHASETITGQIAVSSAAASRRDDAPKRGARICVARPPPIHPR